MSGSIETPDCHSSYDFIDFRDMVKAVRTAEQATSSPFAMSDRDKALRAFGRKNGKRGGT